MPEWLRKFLGIKSPSRMFSDAELDFESMERRAILRRIEKALKEDPPKPFAVNTVRSAMDYPKPNEAVDSFYAPTSKEAAGIKKALGELKASRKHDFVLNQLYTKAYGYGSAYYFTCTICGETIRQSKKDFWSLEKTYVRTVDCKPR